jgi:HK97 family phage portal protein
MGQGNDTSFWSSFFGINPRNDQRYINQWGLNWGSNIDNRIWGVKQPIWIDTHDAYLHYLEVPELRTVINKRADMMASGVPVLIKTDTGEVVDQHWVLDLIANPNPTQSWCDVIFSLSVNDSLYSNVFAYAPKRSFDVVNLMVPLPSDKMIINTTGKRLKQMDIDGLIKDYEFCYDDGNKDTLEVDEVIYLTTPDGLNIINPNSRMDALKYPISNIKAAYSKRNVLLENIGAIGILSAQKGDLGGAIPMTPEEKTDIQRDWYRRSKDELIITEADVSWQPMSFPTKDLMLYEELSADKMAIVDIFGLNSYVFSQEKGATFSNVKEGLKMAYQTSIIPDTEAMYDGLSEQLGLEDEGLRLVPDFSHIPVLATDENQAAQAMDTRASALLKIQQSGVVLTEEEQRSILHM